MVDYPQLTFPNPETGDPMVASPTGKYRFEFAEPQSERDVVRIVPGGAALTRGATIGATADLGTINIEEVRFIAQSRDQVRVVLPLYRIGGQEFAPRPGTLLVRRLFEEDASRDLSVVLGRVARILDISPPEFEARGALFGGLWEFGISSGFKEPSVEVFAYSESVSEDGSYSVCNEIEHPAGLPFDTSGCVDPVPYADKFLDYDPDMAELPLERATVAVFDSYFEFEHPALNFHPSAIKTIDVPACTIDQHGTSSAGVIGASVTSPNEDAEGELPGARLLAVRVYERGIGAFGEVALARGIRAAVDHGAGVLSISLGMLNPLSCVLEKAVAYAASKRVVVVAGSGNAVVGVIDDVEYQDKDEPIMYPAAYRGVIAVGAAEHGSNELKRCQGVLALGGNASWSSRYLEKPDRPGIDVVAQGRSVVTTNLKNPTDGTPPLYWKEFLGTSAAGPIVAGLAARIRAEIPDLSVEQVRARIQCLAWQPDVFGEIGKDITGFGGRNYSYELGFGWIEQSLVAIDCAPKQGPSDTGPQSSTNTTLEDDMTLDDQSGSPNLDDDCTEVSCDLLPDKSYTGLVDECARPLSVFLRALSDRRCCDLLFDFLKQPYLTARTAGVPWAGAVWLGSGDWDMVNQALLAENNLKQQSVTDIADAIGPIWVKAT